MLRLPFAARTLLPALALGLAQAATAAQPDAPPPVPSPGLSDAPVYVPPTPRETTPPPPPAAEAAPSPAADAPAAAGSPIPSPGYNNYREIPVFVPYSARDYVDPRDKTKGENLLESYYKPKFPATTDPLHRTHRPSWAPGGDIDTGMRVGSPYYWSNHTYPLYGAGPTPRPAPGAVTAGYGYAVGATPWVTPAGCNCNRGGGSGAGSLLPTPAAMPAPVPAAGSTAPFGYGYGDTGYGAAYPGTLPYGPPAAPPAGAGAYGTPGFGANGTSPYPPGTYAGGFASDPYAYHFGPGFHRNSDHAHYRFPYYSYRRPWYHPGHASYNRDTNFPW